MAGSLARSLWLLPTISWLFNFYPNENYEANAPPLEATQILESYDFVVVGGGTAGCVVANRLSEDANIKVLLLEAGGQEPHEAQIPAVAPYLQLTELDWQFQSEPSSTSCLAMMENRCNLPRGKALGGSSSINYMLYVRGNKNDFNLWENFGNVGWGFRNILEYFKKSEDNGNPILARDQEYHGTGGYQKINEAPWRTLLADAFLEAGRELNYPTIDVNGKRQTGFMIPQGFHFEGSRYSASKAFLHPIRNRTNLHILLQATVSKILLNAENRAYGIDFEWKSQNHSVNASKEVILSAGVFGSPQLLMLSGIGPMDHLRSVGITPVVDLPVGQQLQDHIAGHVTFVIDKPMSLIRSRLESLASIYYYSLWGSGPLTTFGGVEGIGYASTKYMNATEDWPDIEFHFISGSFASDGGAYLRYILNLRDEYWTNYLRNLSFFDTFTIISKLMRPRSRGYLQLASRDPKDKIKIFTNYLQEPLDILKLVEGIKIAKSLGETQAFKKLGARMYLTPLPGCEKLESDKYWECYIRHLTLTIFHYCGTVKMGPYWDPDSVVDPHLRVYGTSNLRVVDASIFPTIPSANTNAATMMVAEKASDIIKEFWNLKPAVSSNGDELPEFVVPDVFENETDADDAGSGNQSEGDIPESAGKGTPPVGAHSIGKRSIAETHWNVNLWPNLVKSPDRGSSSSLQSETRVNEAPKVTVTKLSEPQNLGKPEEAKPSMVNNSSTSNLGNLKTYYKSQSLKKKKKLELFKRRKMLKEGNKDKLPPLLKNQNSEGTPRISNIHYNIHQPLETTSVDREIATSMSPNKPSYILVATTVVSESTTDSTKATELTRSISFAEPTSFAVERVTEEIRKKNADIGIPFSDYQSNEDGITLNPRFRTKLQRKNENREPQVEDSEPNALRDDL